MYKKNADRLRSKYSTMRRASDASAGSNSNVRSTSSTESVSPLPWLEIVRFIAETKEDAVVKDAPRPAPSKAAIRRLLSL